jgi:hypothetical protein
MPKVVRGTLRKEKTRITLTVADEDVNESGTPVRYITDLDSNRRYSVTPKSCGTRNCKCENWLHPVQSKNKRDT